MGWTGVEQVETDLNEMGRDRTRWDGTERNRVGSLIHSQVYEMVLDQGVVSSPPLPSVFLLCVCPLDPLSDVVRFFLVSPPSPPFCREKIPLDCDWTHDSDSTLDGHLC